jgi:hypothetical protein
LCCLYCPATITLFIWLINHHTAVLFSRNKSPTNSHPTPIAEHEGGQRHLGNAIAIRAGGGLLVKCMSNSALTPTSPVHRPSWLLRRTEIDAEARAGGRRGFRPCLSPCHPAVRPPESCPCPTPRDTGCVGFRLHHQITGRQLRCSAR